MHEVRGPWRAGPDGLVSVGVPLCGDLCSTRCSTATPSLSGEDAQHLCHWRSITREAAFADALAVVGSLCVAPGTRSASRTATRPSRPAGGGGSTSCTRPRSLSSLPGASGGQSARTASPAPLRPTSSGRLLAVCVVSASHRCPWLPRLGLPLETVSQPPTPATLPRSPVLRSYPCMWTAVLNVLRLRIIRTSRDARFDPHGTDAVTLLLASSGDRQPDRAAQDPPAQPRGGGPLAPGVRGQAHRHLREEQGELRKTVHLTTPIPFT